MTSLDGHGNFFAFPALIKATPPTNFANLFSSCSSSRTAGQRQHLRLWQWLINEESNINDRLSIYIWHDVTILDIVSARMNHQPEFVETAPTNHLAP